MNLALGGGHDAGRTDRSAVLVVAEQEVVVALLVRQAQVVEDLVEQVLVGMVDVQVQLVRAARLLGVGERDRLGVGRVLDQVQIDVQLVA